MLHSVHFFLITFILVIIAINDSRYKKIPNRYVAMIGALSVINAMPELMSGQVSVWQLAAGCLAGGFVLLPAFLLTGKGFGAGDVKLLSALGLGLGAGGIIMCTGGAMAGALIFATVRKKSARGSIAMAPFILFAYILVYCP